MSSGREDCDVRMLGKGISFVCVLQYDRCVDYFNCRFSNLQQAGEEDAGKQTKSRACSI